jgi:hypothetical protein
MSSRRNFRIAVTGLLVLLFIATQTTIVYAQIDTVREASLNWADYASAQAVVLAPEQRWAGDTIREASRNWADYAGVPAVVSAPEQHWAGDTIREASLNWADYAAAPAVAHVSD